MTMKTNKTYTISLLVASLLATTSCVKDKLYNTPHPDTGKVSVSANWTGRGEGVDIPAEWTITMDTYIGKETGATHALDSLFTPGSYRLAAYNVPDNITIDGTTATITSATGSGDGTTLVNNAPGWLLTYVQEMGIEADVDYVLTAEMRQQVRQLTFIVDPTGNATGRVETIVGRLSGVAGTLDFATGHHGTASEVELHFAKITEGTDAGKWAATVRLLGITGDRQSLAITLVYSGSNPQDTRIESDLTEVLKDFNADKAVPMILDGTMVETPDEMGMSSVIISEWEKVNGESGNAEPVTPDDTRSKS